MIDKLAPMGKLSGYVFTYDDALDIFSVYFYEDYYKDTRRHVADLASLQEAEDFCWLLNYVKKYIPSVKSIFEEFRNEIFNN